MKFETIQQTLNELHNNKNLSDSLRFGLLDKAISLATKCDEYQELATYACHDDALGVKDWGRELFQLALDNYEFCYSTENLYNLAFQIADPKQLNDTHWAETLFIQAIEESEFSEDLVHIYMCVTDNDSSLDKKLAITAIEKALSLANEPYEILELASAVANDEAMPDKEGAKEIFRTIENKLETANDYLDAAKFHALSILLNDKVSGRAWFKKALTVNNENYEEEDIDFYEIAHQISRENMLNDKAWAADICLQKYNGISDIWELLKMAKLVSYTNVSKAKTIIEYAMKLIQSPDRECFDDLTAIAESIAEGAFADSQVFAETDWGKVFLNLALEQTEAIN
jgi:hypothetical protein